ncbi:tetratricopeptide repeat protein [Psychroserpens sp. BH13MA-6]
MKKLNFLLFILLLQLPLLSSSQSLERHKTKDSLLNVLERTDSLPLKAAIHFKLYGLNRRHNPDSSLYHLFENLKINIKLKDSAKICLTNSQIGWCYIEEKEEPNSAKPYLETALKLGLILKDTVRIGSAYTFLGFMNQRKGYYRTALDNYFKSLDYKIPLNNPMRLGFTYNLIGKTLELQGQLEKSLEFHFKALNEREKEKKYGDIGHSYQNIASVYYKLKQYGKSLEYYDKALKIRLNQEVLHHHLSDCYNGIAQNYIVMDSLDKAEKLLFKAVKHADSIKRYYHKANALNNLAIISQKKNNNNEATTYALQALEYSTQSAHRDLQRDSYKILSDLASQKDNFSDAFAYFQKYTALKDSIINQETLTSIAELEGIYNTQKKEQEIQSLKQEQEIILQQERFKTLLIYAIVFGALLLISLLTIIYKRRRLALKQKLKLKEKENQITALDLKNKEIKLQHFEEELKEYTQLLITKNAKISQLQSNLEQASKTTPSNNDNLSKLYSSTILTQDDWDTFKNLFEQAYPDFINKLETQYSNLSSGDLRIATLLKLNLSNTEIASVLGISSESVRKNIYRLRSKLKLNSNKILKKLLLKL